MIGLDPLSIGSLGALVLGLLLFVAGPYARRRGRLRYRQGAEILAGLTAATGAAVMGLGTYLLLGSMV